DRKIAYSRLRVKDATGKELTARMEIGPAVQCPPSIRTQAATGGAREAQHPDVSSGASGAAVLALAVVVDDAEAIYPLRMDPTFSDANWISMGGVLGADSTI